MAATLLSGAFAACSDKEDIAADVTTKDYVDFTVGDGDSRTVRDEKDKYQINWDNGDKVRVFCAEAIGANSQGYADYTVEKGTGAANKGKLQYISDGLQWSETAGTTHHFYAVYPADDSKILGETDGVVRFKMPVSQTVKVTEKSTTTVDGQQTTHYQCAPVMDNAYMVAYYDTDVHGKVPLDFQPIMTTIDVTVKNGISPNETNSTITVTGVSIIDESALGSDEFSYNVREGKMVASESEMTATQTFFVSVQNDDEDFVDLESGGSLKFTVFLPPVAINESHKVKVRVHCTGGSPQVVALGGNVQTDADGNTHKLDFKAGSLGSIALKVKNLLSNNWITPLDSNIYVQQLSIPGTNESVAYLSSGNQVNQGWNIENQLAMGIRAFDIHGESNNLVGSTTGWTLYAKGSQSTQLTTLLEETFLPFLEKNPGEFVILQLKTENKSFKNFDSYFEDFLGDKLVQWKPDLRIGECRGKIVCLMRYYSHSKDPYNGWKKPGIMYEEFGTGSGTVHVNISSVKKSDAPEKLPLLYYFARNSGENYTDDRLTQIETMLERTKALGKQENNSGFPWSVCYVAASTNEGKKNNYETTAGYLKNAQAMHPVLFKWMNRQESFGPLGIVYMDWVGRRDVDQDGTAYNGVYGDLLPAAIIDNNYRFTMQR